MIERRQLSDNDVRRIILGSVELVIEAQKNLRLNISPNILETKKNLFYGNLLAETPLNTSECAYGMDYGCFTPPSTIKLEGRLPFSDHPMDLPDLASTLTLYSAVHEVVHADDFIGGDKLFFKTKKHMLNDHYDKLQSALNFIHKQGENNCIRTINDLVKLSAKHYVDMVTHYRSYIILRYSAVPKLDLIWDRLNDYYFPPNLLTKIEYDKGVDYIFSLFNEKAGKYCLIEAFDEYENISKKNLNKFVV
ncbi:hypothetical protein FJY84_05390 [Candidatus Bathyarchaeota archaeon]|nr:hypothetical protein [Candidatus Bathyarchaeota archaeon]